MSRFPGWENIDGSSVSKEEVEEAFRSVMAKVRRIEQSQRPHSLRRIAFMAAAAIALILLPAISFHIARQSIPEYQDISYLTCTTSRGDIREITLPDQTRVTLNSESVLIYPETFGSTRSVFLSGEAVFDVTSSEENPFIVKTSDISIRVHGTKFNVKAYYNENYISTTLCRGAISAYPNGQEDNAVELRPDQDYRYNRETGATTVSTRVNSLEAIAWESGNTCFKSATIQEVIHTVERKYDVNICLTTPKYNNAIITASFIHEETVEDLIGAICMIVPGLKYTIDGNTIYLR